MSSLADLPELVGFFSYSREDEEDSNGALTALRKCIQRELRGQLGLSMKTFRLWQDKEAIASGDSWLASVTTEGRLRYVSCAKRTTQSAASTGS
jgi:hypothetical protein